MSGLIITLAQQKGGAGKTTVAAHLAVACALGGKSVAVLDTDPQGSLGQWFERREAGMGAEEIDLIFRTASGWGARREARALAREHDVVILDTPPKSDLELRPALEAAHLVVIPVQPAPVDLWATEPTLAMVDKVGSRALLLLNRVVHGTLLGAEVAREVAAMGHPVSTTELGSRIAFAASMGNGKTVMETHPNSPASAEVYDLAIEVLAQAARATERKETGGAHNRQPALAAAGGRREPGSERPALAGRGLNGAMPSRASASARRFPALSAWPLTQCHAMS
jgi:chromosome partitioning protein